MKFIPAAAIALFTATPAFMASALTLDFETVTSFASIAEYYNGGADSSGNIGPALGISFGGDALGLKNTDPDPFFTNAPTPLGVLAPVGPASTMNVTAGLADTLGFFYSSSASVPNGVQVWSGLDGTGSVLASFDLAANAQARGCSSSAFCNFDMLSSGFTGLARSVTFGNAANAAAFDNITVTPVPEPSVVLLMSLGAAGLLAARRRRA